MRFAEDRSNINDFAYFIGAKIVNYGDGDEPYVQMADGHTFIHPDNYAIVNGNEVKKWYAGDFEDLLDVADDVENLPAGWEAYPEGFDFSVFGFVAATMSFEEAKTLQNLLYRAKYNTFLTRKSKLAALKADAGFAMVSHVLNDGDETEASVDEVFKLFYAETPTQSKSGAMVGRFYYGPENKTVLVSGYTAEHEEVQKYLNRRLLTKP